MTHEELEEAVPLYATGALDRAERQALEAHLLSGCPACHGALKDYQAVASLLPFGLSPTQPSRALKARIMAARNPAPLPVEDGPKEPQKPSLEPGEWMNHLFPPIAPARSFSLPWAVGFATVALVGIAAYFGITYSARLSEDAAKLQQLEATLQEQSAKLSAFDRENTDRKEQLANLQEEVDRKSLLVAELKEQLIERDTELDSLRQQASAKGSGKGKTPQDELAALMRKPNIRVVSLAGSELAKTSSAFLLYDAGSRKVWLYAVNLPECLNGTVYQLWAIDQKPKSVGTFHMDSGETAHLLVSRLDDFQKAKKFAVSLEPPGGRPQPTGPVYLVGQTS